MKKAVKKKTTKYAVTEEKPMLLQEPEVLFRPVKAYPVTKLKDFSFSEFKKIADKAPFTQGEWASILHVSERTLQRYAKSNGTFAPINAERALQIAKVLDEGKTTFGSTAKFYSWLKTNPYMLEGNISFDSLTTNDGIQKVIIQLGRIQHGILA